MSTLFYLAFIFQRNPCEGCFCDCSSRLWVGLTIGIVVGLIAGSALGWSLNAKTSKAKAEKAEKQLAEQQATLAAQQAVQVAQDAAYQRQWQANELAHQQKLHADYQAAYQRELQAAEDAAEERREEDEHLRKEPERLEKQRQAEAEEQRKLEEEEEAAARVEAELLRLRAYRENYFLDPAYRENRARSETEKIIEEYGPDWSREYDYVTRYTELGAVLKESAPEVFEWLEARLELVRLAELIRVEPKRSETDEVDWERKMLRFKIEGERKKALVELKLKQNKEMRELLESEGVDEDAIEEILSHSFNGEDSRGGKPKLLTGD